LGFCAWFSSFPDFGQKSHVSVIIFLLSLPRLLSGYKITSPGFIANLRLNETGCKSFSEYDLKNWQITHTALGSEHKLSGQAPLSFCKISILRKNLSRRFCLYSRFHARRRINDFILIYLPCLLLFLGQSGQSHSDFDSVIIYSCFHDKFFYFSWH